MTNQRSKKAPRPRGRSRRRGGGKPAATGTKKRKATLDTVPSKSGHRVRGAICIASVDTTAVFTHVKDVFIHPRHEGFGPLNSLGQTYETWEPHYLRFIYDGATATNTPSKVGLQFDPDPADEYVAASMKEILNSGYADANAAYEDMSIVVPMESLSRKVFFCQSDYGSAEGSGDSGPPMEGLRQSRAGVLRVFSAGAAGPEAGYIWLEFDITFRTFSENSLGFSQELVYSGSGMTLANPWPAADKVSEDTIGDKDIDSHVHNVTPTVSHIDQVLPPGSYTYNVVLVGTGLNATYNSPIHPGFGNFTLLSSIVNATSTEQELNFHLDVTKLVNVQWVLSGTVATLTAARFMAMKRAIVG